MLSVLTLKPEWLNNNFYVGLQPVKKGGAAANDCDPVKESKERKWITDRLEFFRRRWGGAKRLLHYCKKKKRKDKWRGPTES